MKKLLPLIIFLTTFTATFAQEGTKQLMPNANDRLFIEFNVFDDSNFGLYDCDEHERINIFLNAGEKMFFGMRMVNHNYGGSVHTDPDYMSFRIIDPDGQIFFPSTTMPEDGDPGYINSYSEAISGPNGAFLNNTLITTGYPPIYFTASKTGNYNIQFQTWGSNHRTNGDNSVYRRRFALEYFDVTVTDSENNIISNPGEPNKSAGRLWSYGWQLTNTSFYDYRVNAHFYVFTSDEFINKVNFRMYPYSFVFVANRYGITPYSEENYIKRVQSMEGDQVSGEDLAEYKVFLNDPDRSVWPNTRLAPPTVQVKAEDQLYMDYQYNRYPAYSDIDRGTILLEKNNESCPHEDITFFSIETNIEGYTAIMLDLDGDGEYSAEGSDRVIYRELKKGLNYVLWDFKTDGGAEVADGEYSASATFFGRGPAHFPMYDVEQMDGITTSSIRPFNRLNTTIYWDDSQIDYWGDYTGQGRMDGTAQKQLKISTNTPRNWVYHGAWQGFSHNGEENTLNTWFNAIDLGYNDIVFEVAQSDTKCLNGEAPWVGDVYKEGPKNNDLIFEAADFDPKFSHPANTQFQSIRITSLPEIGELRYNESPISVPLEVTRGNLTNLTYTPPTDWIGKTPFTWEAFDGTLWSNNEEAVYCIINSAPTITEIDDQVLCTNSETQPLNFTVGDDDTAPDELTITGFSANPSVVPHSGIEIEGTGSDRTVTIKPVPYESGHAIIYLMVEDGLSQTIEEFAVTIAPSLQFSGDTSLCVNDPLQLIAEEFGADSYSWSFDNSIISTERTVEQTSGNVNYGEWSLSIEKYIEEHDITCTSTRNFNVTYSPNTNFTGDQDVCVGQEISLTADEVNAIYQWRRGGTDIESQNTGTFSKEAALADDGNDYTLWVNKDGCQWESDPFAISVVVMPSTGLTITPGTVDPGRDGEFVINSTENGFLYRAYYEGAEIASATSTGGELSMTIPAQYLEIGENTFELTVDNTNCEVPLTNPGIINVNEPGITVSPVTLSTSEDGATQTFSVVLNTAPLNTVSIDLYSDDETEGTIAPETLTFDAGSWDTPQTVTVTPVREWEVDGDISYSIILEPVISDDTYYSDMNPDDVSVTNTNVDVAGINISHSELTTSEAETTADFTVVLTSVPSVAVRVEFSGLDASEGSMSTNELIFDATDWNVPQTITITGVDDDIDDGLQSYTLQGTVISGDNNYDDMAISSITVNNEDDDNAGLNISETAVTTYEDETQPSATFEISLNSEPESTVTMNLSSTNSDEGQLPTTSQTLTFNNANWSTAKTVTINGVDDDIDDGDQTYVINISTSATDVNYNSLSAAVNATNVDDDQAGISVSENSIETSEDETTATFSVVLDSEPVSDVTIDITSSDTEAAESTISASQLTFTPANWNTAQEVTVSGVDDHLIDGDQNYTITLSVNNGDANYRTLGDISIDATNTDNDVAAIMVSKTTLQTSEDGASDNFDIRLSAQPESNVTITINGLDASEGSLSNSSLTFTPGNWNTNQTVTVTGVNDEIADGNIVYTLTTTASSSYTPFNGINADDIEVTNLDNNTAGISVSPANINLSEGENATFSISLSSQPTSDVTITLSSSDENEVTVSPGSVTFSPSDWAAKNVTITAINDLIDDGDHSYTITTSNASGSEPSYGGMAVDNINVYITDVHSAGVTTSVVSGNTTEAGGTAAFTVVLESKPTANVEITATSDNATEGQVASGTLTFTPANWDTPQTVTIMGMDDDIDDGNQNYNINVEVTSADSNYDTAFDTSFTLVNEDDDTAGLTIVQNTPLGTTEAGGTATFTVVLDSEPVSDVTVASSSNTTPEGRVTSGNTLTFTPSNWNTPQTVTITGQDDAIDDGNQEYQIDIEISSADTNYGSNLNTSLSLSNEDDDAFGVTLSPVTSVSDRLETSEDGGQATFTVVLESEPTHQVSFNFVSGETGEGTVTSSVAFSSSDWNTPKTITVTGVNDDVDDEDQDYMVSITTSSSDNNYNNLSFNDIYLTNIDNDDAGIVLSKTAFETSEPDVTDNLSISLQSEPTSDVTISFDSSDETEGTVAPETLTFSPGNWDVNQEVVITGQDDAVMDGDINYNITISVSSSDNNYSNLSDQTLPAINNDNDLAGITVTPTAGLYTSETGVTAGFSITLNSEPTEEVRISLTSSDITEGVITAVSRGTVDTDANSATITFQPDEWNDAVEITVTGQDDEIDDSDVAYNIITQAAVSADNDYNNHSVSDVSLTNQDNDAYGTTVTPQDIALDEDGAAKSFTIVLKSRPTSDVTYNLTAETDGRATVSPESVTFSTEGNDWQTPKEVTITPVNNDIDDGNLTFTVVPGKGDTEDAQYKNHSPASVSVTLTDEDISEVDISEPSGPTSEGGAEAHFSMGLKSAPGAQILFVMSSSDTSEGKITNISGGRGTIDSPNNQASVTYDDTNWSEPVTITVTGQNDEMADGNQTYYINFEPIVGGTSSYNGMLPDPVTFVNQDNNTAGYMVSPSGGLEITEAGQSDSFTISLNTQPEGNVVINLSSDDTTEGVITAVSEGRGTVNVADNEATVTFNTTNWDIPATVTLTGVDDEEQDGDETFNISTSYDDILTEDENYKIEISDVSVTNTDDFTPRPQDDAATTDQETPVNIDILANDAGLEYGATVAIVSQPEHGEATVNPDNTITFTPDRMYHGAFSLEYEITNSINQSATAMVSINVTHINVTPVANDDSRGTSINTPVEVDVLMNDENLFDGPINITIADASATNGTVSVSSNSSIAFSPDQDFTGITTFSYRITDNEGDSDEANVTIHVREENHQPVANDDELITYTNTPANIDVLSNDSGLEDGLQNFSIFAQPANGTISINSNRTLHYVPDADFTGNDLLIYQIEDVDGDYALGVVNIQVLETPDATPVANDVAVATEFETPVTIDILFNDTGLEDGVAGITISPQPVNGTALINADFTITYTPDAGFSGTETFGYQVCDQDGDCASANITVTVKAENVENHLPIATDDQATTYLNTPVTIDVLSNDTGLEDGMGNIAIPTSPASGSVQVNADHTVTFTPGYFFVGDISFSYIVADANGDWDMALVTVSVTEDENIVPVATDDAATVEENSSVNIDVLGNDTGLNDTPVSVGVSQQPTNGTVVVESDNTVTYTPDSEFFGNDSFNYTVTDANGDADDATVLLTITQAASGIPVATDDEASTTENTAVSINVLSNDTGLEDAPVVVTISTNPTNGTVVVESDNTITYTPDNEFFGNDSFNYTVTDANGDADQANVAVTVTEDTNNVPVATDDEASTTENTAVSINVLSNDTGLEDAPVVVTISTNPTSGSVVVESDNTVTYTPNDAFSGSDSFTYTVTDANGDADQADVAVTVTEDTNNVPVATDDEASTTENTAVSINVLSNDTGLADAPIVVTISTNPTSGSVVVESDNTVTYTPNDAFSGSDSFSYTVTDANGDADQANVAVTISEDSNEDPNVVPIAADDYAETNINVAVNIAVLDNDQGLDNSPVILSVSQIAEGGSAIVENDNTITFTPETNFIGQVTFRYAIVDSNGDQDMATVTVEILPGITAINDTIVIEMNETVNISPLKNDLDINGQVQFSILKHPENGTAGFKGAGILTYDPQFNFVGNDSISYQVCSEDNSNDCSSAWIIIQIEEPEFVPTTTFRIPEGFSPDGDGINDYFEIEGLEDYDRVTIHVFNRFGNIIYENDNYQNTWDGTTRKSLGGSGSLPTGTYFYVIKVVDTGKQYKGNVFLKK
ncbi:gliding motility-associated-like protein [Marinilabilia salmonicolor]|jgi:gliding motility-associated-like protein|uniref:Ig-like domain-containing protein n=1 Tax=Marinilabilia salmonicolor TaxID=989 RepID=UPI000D081435|nr:Ig-like domain-containing protein [Marinilabilia salmonicolor]PRY97821.1 gliding motility-associated-like protein [Marinilabilia salmonicolor]